MIATPRPPSTLGSAVCLAYTRRPGLLIRRTPAIERSRLRPYLSWISSVLPTTPSRSWTSKEVMYPSCLRISATPCLSLLYGIDTESWYAWLALRRRVSMSAIGSVIVMAFSALSPLRFHTRVSGGPVAIVVCGGGLPGALGHAGELAAVGHLPQADPAQAELAVDGLRPATALAAGVAADSELGLASGLDLQCGLRHVSSP